MTHDHLCPLAEPCSKDEPRHGFCGNATTASCLHCERECACDLIAKAREDTLAKCIEVVEELFTIDRWAGLYLAANALRALEENP